MTAQDSWPGLEEDREQPDTPPSRRRRWVLAGSGALAALLVLAGVAVVGLRMAATPAATSTASAPPPIAAADTTATTPQQGRVVIEAALRDPAVVGDAGQPAPLIVGTQSLQGGVTPDRVPNFDTCHADAATLQYLPVQIRRPENWLSATLTVQTTATTPSGIGRLGFFFQAGDASTPCPDGAWSTSDSFLASNVGQQVITGYVVLDQALAPSTPQGRSDVFRTLRLRVSNIRSSGRLAIVSPPTVGSLCPGTQDELCASLG
ncbi:MAG TPA: hypothetical protein VGN28_07645 [Blastococcus sp.]|jgi:hypothetical protein|nr:hypothetical protein [Blastococcus sp.]